MRNITVELGQAFSRATAVSLNQRLEVTNSGQRRKFTLPSLKGYEVVVLE